MANKRVPIPEELYEDVVAFGKDIGIVGFPATLRFLFHNCSAEMRTRISGQVGSKEVPTTIQVGSKPGKNNPNLSQPRSKLDPIEAQPNQFMAALKKGRK